VRKPTHRRQLVRGMQTSPPNQFHELFLVHQHEVFAYIVTLVPDRNDADDIFQETCLKLFEKAREFDTTRNFFPWACGFALNEVRRFRRSHLREQWQFNDAVLESIADIQVRLADKIQARLQLLMDCLAELPPEKKELLLQCYGCRESLNNLAAQFKIEPHTLRKRLERIRRTLFECMTRDTE
jgi:RNA polymerase sigma-70 factor, ECF subfamily